MFTVPSGISRESEKLAWFATVPPFDASNHVTEAVCPFDLSRGWSTTHLPFADGPASRIVGSELVTVPGVETVVPNPERVPLIWSIPAPIGPEGSQKLSGLVIVTCYAPAIWPIPTMAVRMALSSTLF